MQMHKKDDETLSGAIRIDPPTAEEAIFLALAMERKPVRTMVPSEQIIWD
jgi:hypothetical protein